MTTQDEKINVYQELLNKCGATAQSFKAIEELCELSRAIAKLHICRSKENELNVCEEIADAYIMLEQLKLMFPGWLYQFNKKLIKIEDSL